MTERMPFKEIDELFEADDRNKHYVLYNEERRFRLSDFHNQISEAQLNRAVPTEVHNQFNMSKNLCLYGWYVYDFGMAAELYGYIAVEMALKCKYQQITGDMPQRNGLRQLLKWAIDQGLAKDGGFRHLNFRDDEYWERFPEGYRLPKLLEREGTEYISGKLLDAMPNLRNDLGHGSQTLMGPVDNVATLYICADLINQLFPDERKE